MKKNILTVILTLVFCLTLLCGCGSKTTVTDLTGTWKSENNNGSWMEAVISGDTIEVNWVSDNGDTKSLYWAGSYTAPAKAASEYSWDSENDHTKTDDALLASGDDTKTFTYKNGQISYSVSALGTTTTMHLSKEK